MNSPYQQHPKLISLFNAFDQTSWLFPRLLPVFLHCCGFAMGLHGFSCFHAFPWFFMVFHDFIWVFIVFYGISWFSWFLWFSMILMKIYDSPCISWFYMIFHDFRFPCKSIMWMICDDFHKKQWFPWFSWIPWSSMIAMEIYVFHDFHCIYFVSLWIPLISHRFHWFYV